jgi:acyl dehydratase
MQKEFTNQYTFEDLTVGDTYVIGRHQLERQEILDFGRQWDPMPFHIDEDLANASHHGGLIASGTHMLAIRIKLLQSHGTNPYVIASMGYEEVKFLLPSRPGDEVTLHGECVWKRESKSQPDRGIAKFSFTLINQKDETVLSMVDTIFILKSDALD